MASITRDYWTTWKQFVLQGMTHEDALPPALMQSWRRCAASGLDPYGEAACEEALAHAHTGISQSMLTLVRPVMEDLHQFIEGSGCVVVFADADVRIVDCFGDKEIQVGLEHLGLTKGASWHEECQGSNALSIALQESFPIQLDGPMHYRAALHSLYTSAAPVHDLLGRAVGVLGVIGRHEQCHPHTLGMITAAAQAMSNQLQMQVWLNNANDLLAELKSILQTLPEGVLLLRKDGVISQMNTPAGAMLGLIPARVSGRQLGDILPVPAVLAQAIARQHQLTDEELVFDTARGRVTCLCSLKPIANYHADTGLADIVGSVSSTGSIGSTGLILDDPVAADGYVLILRSIERVQKLVNRMTGARARLTFDNVVGASPALKEAMRLALLAARSNSTVLLRGETGTGKEIFAQSIHNSSARSDGPFVAVNCAAIPRELINTELFGYEGGSFTGADRQGRSGKFEQAHGGTLFLDEIGDMPLDLQSALLRAIETRSIVRVGGQRMIPVDVRIIAATHRDLREEARRGNFRSDLFYRLNVLTIHIPALRERADDIPMLVHHFLERQSRALGRSLTIAPEAMQALRIYNWPGNIRELENLLERVTYLMPGSIITLEDVPLELWQAAEHSPAPHAHSATSVSASASQRLPVPAPGALKEHSSSAEMQAILDALRASDNQVTRAATLLGISRTTLWRKMAKYGLK